MNTTHPPVGPTEQEVRQHFGDKLSPDAKLMRPAYTSIWALEDGTLLWDWKNGYNRIGAKLKCIMYVTGPQGYGKSSLVRLMRGAVEVGVNTVNSRLEANILHRVQSNAERETLVFTAHQYSQSTATNIKRIAEEFGATFFNINLTHN